MPEIVIAVNNRVPIVVSDTRYVITDNTDYTIRFDFDEEWADAGTKTVWFANGFGESIPVLMDGDACTIPKITTWKSLYVGVQAGDLQTSRECSIRVIPSIARLVGTVDPPTPDVWAQIVDRLLCPVDKTDDMTQPVGRDEMGQLWTAPTTGTGGGGIAKETDPTVPTWAKQPQKPSYTAAEVGALPATTKIPAKMSDLDNDSGFITRAVADLANYYAKSETYSRDEIDQRISAIPKFAISVVSALPTSGISETTIYLVGGGDGSDLYTEYINVGGKWEVLGSQKVDLTGYATQDWVLEQIKELGTGGGESCDCVPAKVYTVTSDSVDVDELAKDITPNSGDTLVVTNSLGEKSAYQYDAELGWVACDGLVDASKVIFAQDFTLAGNYTNVGNVSKDSTSAVGTLAMNRKSVVDLMEAILDQTLQPSITGYPAVTLTFSQAKAYEVGTTVTPQYSASLSAGSYTFGPATGVKANAWEITDTDGHTAATASGSFAAFVVEDNTSYSITAKATYGEGAVAHDNKGNPSDPVVRIPASTASRTSGKVTGYRSFFYGVLPTSSAEAPLTSAIIRGLTNGGAYNGQKKFTMNGSATAKRMVIAIPAASTRGGLGEVILTSAMNTPITDSYVLTEKALKVEGANGAVGVDYDVYVYEPASIDAGEVHAVTLA